MESDRNIALAIALYHRRGDKPDFGIPETLGSGCYRTAYLGPDGMVYKVGSRYSNSDEAEKALSLRSLNGTAFWGFKVRIPETRFIEFNGSEVPDPDSTSISAMEFAGRGLIPTDCASTYTRWDGTERACDCNPECRTPSQCWGPVIRDGKNHFGLHDLHGQNIFLQPMGLELWPIDLQM